MIMKKIIFTILAASVIGSFVASAHAQMMGGFSNSSADWDAVVEHTIREEREGKEVWDKLQAKQIECADLSDEEFGVRGEYFMGQMAGDSHAAMNAMMMQTHGEEGEEKIHIVMGRRLSGCDTEASFPAGSGGWMPMMNMMWGGWSSPFGLNSSNNMMNFGYGSGFFGSIFMILWWVLLVAGVIALIKWLRGQSRGNYSHEKSPLEILKERYARGEIDKKEFEERKRDVA